MNVSLTGTLIGGALGLLSGGPLGALAGAAIGHFIDRRREGFDAIDPNLRHDFDHNQRVPELFFKGTFLAMGRLAKADGRVSEREIAAARQIMDRMRLDSDQRKLAIGYFTQGKLGNIDLELTELKAIFSTRRNLAMMFVEIQLTVAYADGRLCESELLVLKQTCQSVGINSVEFAWIHSRVRAASGQSSRHRTGATSAREPLARQYAVLGVSPDVSDAALKSAYRKLISQHHPDKLLAKGLPEEMIQLAKEKTQEIQNAYDAIKARRRHE